jgi:hypothetical protein
MQDHFARSAAHYPAPRPDRRSGLSSSWHRMLRPSDESVRVLQVAVAISEMLAPLGLVLQPAENVSLREILPGFTKILPRRAEVLSGFTEVIVAMVAMVAMVVVVAMGAMVVVVAMVAMVALLLEQSLQQIETDTDTWEHR